MTHDTTSSIEEMVENLLRISPTGGTNFHQALITACEVMEQSWSGERYLNIIVIKKIMESLKKLCPRSPVVVFLSDGEGWSEREAMTELCDRAVTLGYEQTPRVSFDVLISTLAFVRTSGKRSRFGLSPLDPTRRFFKKWPT